jgi:hypothetical protein
MTPPSTRSLARRAVINRRLDRPLSERGCYRADQVTWAPSDSASLTAPLRAPDLWCADLFLSGDDGLRWIATDVKSNPRTITPRRELPPPL